MNNLGSGEIFRHKSALSLPLAAGTMGLDRVPGGGAKAGDRVVGPAFDLARSRFRGFKETFLKSFSAREERQKGTTLLFKRGEYIQT